MQAMPNYAVLTAAGVILLAAAAGTYLGVSRSLAAVGFQSEEGGAVVPAVTPVSSAKAIVAPSTLDEAEVRRLAREEAQALIVKAAPAPRKAAAHDDDDADADTTSSKPPTIAPIVPLAPPKPVPAAPQG